jgi:dual specificity phosphatase 12
MGRSRSATMVIMYLMRKYQVDLNTAFDIVKVRRDIIDPNEGFMQKLQTYEGKQYKLKRTITVRENEKIDEIDEIDEVEEFSGYSDFEESSSTSSEDLMDQHRDSSGLFKFPNKHKKHSQDEHISKKCISALGSMEV